MSARQRADSRRGLELAMVGAMAILSACAEYDAGEPAGGRPSADRAPGSGSEACDATQPGASCPAAEVRRAWQRYLDSRGGFYSRCWVPSPLWRRSERERWPCFDLAGSAVPLGMDPDGISVEPTESSDAPEYEIRTRYRWRDSAAAGGAWGDRVTTTVYAIREDGRWAFSNALLRTTGDWSRETVGPVTYVREPGLSFDPEEARRAIAFTDSVAAAFDVPPLGPTTYYVTSSVDAAYGIVGVEFAATVGPGGGFARPVNGQVFSGTPALGGAYRHELLHLILMPLHTSETTVWASEGVATWLGGTSGRDYEGAVAELEQVLRPDPAASLASILSSASYSNAERYPAAAVLVAMVFEAGGIPAVETLLRSGPSLAAFKRAAGELLQLPWKSIETRWREAVRQTGEGFRRYDDH